MIWHNKYNQAQAGFSLIEMAIVLFIIALLLGGLLPVVSSQIEQQRRIETRKLMGEVRESLIGYVMVNGRLPFPACGTIPTLPSINNNAGVELSAASAVIIGCAEANRAVLPWATLGVTETDAWGNRFTYRVSPPFANAVAAGTSSSFLLNSNGDMTIQESTIGGTIASTIPVVVLSHGVNACGAYQPSGLRFDDDPATPLTHCTDLDQQENVNNDITIISKVTTATFDDLAIWISSNTLISRMVTVGKLP